MKIEHIAIWANDLESMKEFYLKFFDMSTSEKLKLEQAYSSDGFDKQELRIAKILGSIDLSGTTEGLIRYRKHLIKKLKDPFLLTGIEDFSWEEKYVFGYGSKEEYEELKKVNPSFEDQFKMLGILEVGEGERDLYVRVSRTSDLKKFELPLSELECVDSKTKNYKLLHDFSVWIVNY